MMPFTTKTKYDAWWGDLCGPVDRRTRRRLDRLGREHTYEAGETIVAEGARADRFAVITSGEVVVESHGRELARLGVGDHFGEVAMLYARPAHPAHSPATLDRTATVRAAGATTVRLLDRAELMTLMDASSAAASRITRTAVGRLAVITAGVGDAQPSNASANRAASPASLAGPL